MKASTVYKRLAEGQDNYVGPMSTKVNLIEERDMGRIGVFALEFVTMKQFPVKSYGKLGKSYQLEMWSYDDKGELVLEKEMYFLSKRELIQAFNNFGEVLK